MRKLQRVYGFVVLGLFLSQPAYAHGQDVLIFPFAIVFGLHLIPVVDFFRRRLWSYAALYVFTQPAVWLLAAGAGYGIDFFWGPSIGLAGGFVALAILPFVYWRQILRWSQADVSA